MPRPYCRRTPEVVSGVQLWRCPAGHDGSIFYLPREQAAVVVASNAADETSVPSQALWGEIVKALYPESLPSWG